jgi:hypothetical protein
MAIKGPALVHDSTNSSGLGSLTLNNNAAAGRRGLADAVAEGHCANGDQVPYYISNATLAGPALVFEHGLGTISSNGITLSRDTIYQSSDGTTKVDLPAGAQYDVVIGVGLAALVLAANNGTEFTAATFATNLGLPRLAAANTFTDQQTISRTSGALLSLTNPTAVRTWDLRTTSGGAFRLTDATAAVVPLEAAAGGATLTVGAGTTLTKSGGSSYDNFPAGTKLLFGTAPPTGWTRVDDATTNRSILTSKAADSPGATGGSWTISGLSFSGTSGSTTLTESQIPAHTHGTNAIDGFVVKVNIAGSLASPGAGSALDTRSTTASTGGGTGHSHSISGSPVGDGNWRPAYQIWAPATKN